jgi:hypothetical protein
LLACQACDVAASKRTRPESIVPGGGTMPMMLRANVVLPAPDSPTMPTISPRAIDKSMHRSAINGALA